MGNCLQRTKNVDHISTNNPASTPGSTQIPSPNSHPFPTPSMPLLKSNVKDRAQVLPIPRPESEILSSPHLKSFSFTELQNATRNFRPDSLLGEGGFGYVFKGWLDKEKLTAAMPGSGMVVAVKKLKPKGFQGHKEWLCEVNYLGQLDHPNLVKLIGFCLEGDNRMLVYEFMPRGCLEDYLFTTGGRPLSWEIRIKVAIQTARGLSFLHGSKPQIIFRDFKASNILLDTEFNAKLSDFGLAKAGPTGDLTHVTTQVFGTQGYAAPEYVSTGRLTAKCDVYSFGVVLLELLTGRLAVDKRRVGPEQKLLDWVKPQLPNKKKLFRIMDSKLEGQYPRKGAFVAANLALQCAHSEPKYRPQMSEVVSILEKIPALKHARAPSAMEGVETLSSPLDDSTSWLSSNLSSMKQTAGKSRKTSAQGSSPSSHGHRMETCPKGSSLPVHHMISSSQGSSEILGDDK